MRKAPLARLFFTLSAVAAAGVWACGGSDTQDVVATDAGTDTGAVEKDSGGEEEKKDSGPHDAGPADTGVKLYDAGEPNVLDAGEEFEGGIPCVVGGELEEEPNDTHEEANNLNPTRCGVIKVVDGGAESDFLTFTLGDASTGFYVQYAGNVNVLVETDGSAPIDITQGSPTLPFRRDQPYYVEVKSKDKKQQVWRVTLFQQQQ
ncbi:MAG: hypothetical protein BGO98_47730 [Myxococcales bacterium 68-20]|nr:hypothetical protein [Myxococcales bacterium]OJY29546.1 MAG: hypothetical protein BGO98_47730 [Myxococcales bacterium 68-20]